MPNPGDYVHTPHATCGRCYVVLAVGSYANGTPRVTMREVDCDRPAIGYPADMLTTCNRKA